MITQGEVAALEQRRQAEGTRRAVINGLERDPELGFVVTERNGAVLVDAGKENGWTGGYALGMSGSFSEEDADWFVSFFVQRGIAPRTNLNPFAAVESLNVLGQRGFVPRAFENLWFHSLSEVAAVSFPEGIRIEVVDRDDSEMVEAIGDLVAGYEAGKAPESELLENARRSMRIVAWDEWCRLFVARDAGGTA
ncbi:MAG: hypothetical protein AAGB34_11305, partial [Planctomycetota bacterium]